LKVFSIILFGFCIFMGTVLPENVAAEEKPGISGDIFGKRGGYIHGYLSLAEQWTDNLFYTRDDTQSDFVTFVSPGIRFSLPGTKEDLLSVSGSTTAPGGMAFGRRGASGGRGFQAYLSYTPEFEFHADNSDEDIVTHLAGGLLSWRLRSGLTLELINRYSVDYQDYYQGISGSRNEYASNLVGLNVFYPVGSRLDLRFDYHHYQIMYDAEDDDDRDRTDQSLSAYLFYKVLSKSSVFINYHTIDIRYDQNAGAMDDSVDQQWFGGFQWDITAKSGGTVKIGTGEKRFDDKTLGTENEIVFEARIDHHFTPKTSAALRAYRRQEETTIETTDYTLTQFVGLDFTQQLMYRIQASIDLDHTSHEYKGGYVVDGDRRQRDDHSYTATFGLNYAPRGWLSFGLEYGYEQRRSNFDQYDFSANRVLFRITGAI
jgi:hypothetical protein